MVGENFGPLISFNLRKFELGIVWVHGVDLVPAWRTQNLDYLNKLVDATIPRENRLPKKKLSDNAAYGPYINSLPIVGCAKN